VFRLIIIVIFDNVHFIIFVHYCTTFVKKTCTLEYKTLHSLESKIADTKKQLSKLDEQIAEAQRMVVTLVRSSSYDDPRWCKEELNSNITMLRRNREKLNAEYRKVRSD